MRNGDVRLSPAELADAYYSWLCDLINVNQRDKSYWLLANALHQKDFEWTVPNDDNRACEGKNLREEFCDDEGIEYIYDAFHDQCSMLEMIIALAYRCEEIMVDQMEHMEMVDWFWRILENVQLDELTDDAFYALHGPIMVDEISERIINRTYHRNGEGGLFPLKHPKKDQRKVELWYQMNAYLMENYYNEDAVV
jgi:hypothetical protein